MSAVTPFILERTAAGTVAAAKAAREQVELLQRQNQLLEELLKFLQGEKDRKPAWQHKASYRAGIGMFLRPQIG